jgi:hypothetical protein
MISLNPRLSVQEEQLTCCFHDSELQPVASSAADALCDEMMLHVFTCSTCLDESEEACAAYQSLKMKMEQAGGPVHGRFLAM